MFNKLEILKMAHGMATHAAARQSVVARNIANADTPGFQAQDITSFKKTYDDDAGFATRSTRSGHIAGSAQPSDIAAFSDTTADASPNGNSVSLEVEMVKSVQSKSQHDMALTVYHSAMGILRTSLGR
ncbi:FlgB family protein [Actibacterium lipolyticum]|uniref:Flagellar basal body rod protein FlgB n=1 Tax=Actibacterium lipolyticum TaxID=1524263 RepID=A0A238KX78_9RHOB|nr:FlgB family protein [Actibacterium lipolyticum]SMX47444.1 Flagellar basal body rod protein FlgB [Actibacterium lipolyticum]